MSKRFAVPIAILFACAFPLAAEEPPLSVLLEKGIFAEETEGNLEEAVQIYRQIAEKTEANREIVAQAKLRLGECYLELAKVQLLSLVDRYGDQEQIASRAKERLASMGENETPVKMDPLASEEFAAQGWQLWNQRKLGEAEAEFEKATQADPSSANAWNGLGWSQSNQGKYRAAKVAFEKCLEIEGQHPAALNGLGWIAKTSGNTDEAIGYWSRAIEAEPGSTAALNGLATTYMEQEDYEKAKSIYEKWLKVDPGNEQASAGLEKVRDGKQSKGGVDPGDFIEVCEERMKVVKSVDPGSYRDKKTLDSAYDEFLQDKKLLVEEKESLHAAVKDYLSAHRNDEDYRWRILQLLSKIASDLGRTEEAREHLDRTLETYPEVDYPIPSKHSKYQHLLNDKAGMIWDEEGVEAAENFILDRLKADPKFDYFFSNWWETRYNATQQTDRLLPLLQKVQEAYQARAEKFPDKKAYIEECLQSLEGEIERASPK
jgi:tetratricopeptide (TPR) repeat protein